MFNRIKSVLFVFCVVMVFTAQTYRIDNKNQQGTSASRPTPVTRTQVQAPRQEAPRQEAPRQQAPRQEAPRQQAPRQEAPRQAVPRQEAPRQIVRRAMPPEQVRQFQPARQERQEPRTYAIVNQVPVENNRLLSRQHHNHWQPRYNFYDNQYHFYPYVNIASEVELSEGYILAGPDGQNYFYEQGTFYIQDQSGQYVAIPPPVGIIVNPLAAGARQIIVNGQVFYRYKGVFYLQVAQGFQVIGPIQ